MPQNTSKTSKRGHSEEGVLGSLPATRPNRMSRRARTSDDATSAPAENRTPATAAKARPAAAKAKAAPAAAAKPKAKPAAKAKAAPAAAAKPKATPARPKAVPAAAKPKAAAAKPKAAPEPAAAPKTVQSRRPRAVSAGAPALRQPAMRADAARENAAEEVAPKPQGGTDLAATVVKAAGELAQIGLTVSGQILKRALPRRD